jgi:hypothetical protein
MSGTDDGLSAPLVNGQIHYGELAERNAGYLRLVNGYYGQGVHAQNANQANNQLVNRNWADWNDPL